MKDFLSLILLIFLFSCSNNSGAERKIDEAFSSRLLEVVRNDGNYMPLLDSLNTIDPTDLNLTLSTDQEKIAFWINTYNSLVQIGLKESSASYKDKTAFFEDDNYHIFQIDVSLNDIENVFLRGQQGNNSLSKLSSLKVKKIDPRIHFALNCGASSCPPISFYNSKDLDKQLNLAEKVFIEGTSEYDPFSDEVSISELLEWYKDDFGGESGLIILLKRNKIIPLNSNPEIIYNKYNWTPQENNFSE